MYVLQDAPQSNTLGDFGFIPWQAIVGLVQAAGYGTAAATKYSATKKYLKKQKKTQQLTHAQQLELKKKELANKNVLTDVEGKRQLYEDAQIKKFVIITVVTLLIVTIVGLGTYYALSVGGDDA